MGALRHLACAAGLAAAVSVAPATAGCGRAGSEVHRDGPPTPAPMQTAAPVRLVVLLVIDQLPSWSFDREQHLLTKGIRRLIDEGVYFPRAEFPYAITFTAPGHATLGTGAPPSVTGILANGWFRPEEDKLAAAIADADNPVFRLAGEAPEGAEDHGASAKQLKVDGIADALRAQKPGARTISVALKSRAAIFALGRRPDLAVWYEADQPAMTTSRYYADEVPAWLRALAETRPIADRLDYVWRIRDEYRLGLYLRAPDDQHGEGGDYGMGVTFPHDLAKAEDPAGALKTTPLGDELVLETALAAIDNERLGEDDVVDLLSVSFSSHDYAGHAWGHESWERLEMLYRLDHTVDELLRYLDERLGPDGYAVVLASDHGATPLVERTLAEGKFGKRVYNRDVKAAADEAATALLGPSPQPWIEVVTGSSIYLTPAALALPDDRKSALLDAIVEAVVKVEGIAYATRTERVAGDCEAREGMDYYACYSVMPERSGQVFFAPQPGCLLTSSYTTGTSHGSANDDDRIVPVIVHAPGLAPRRDDELVSTLSVAPTLATLLGIAPPPAATTPALHLR